LLGGFSSVWIGGFGGGGGDSVLITKS